MIEVRDLSKNYGPYQAIKNLNFSVQKGEVIGFLGPNGAGKTTTMKIITGFMAPSSGSAKIAGYDVFENPIEVKRRIGYLPETPPVYHDMRVEDYLQFVANLKGVEKGRVKAMVERALEKTNLGQVRHRLIGNLSKGFRQRVGISQALVSDPEVLILDEPTVGLDPRQVAEIRDLIKELAGQHTVILSTHILPEVQAICQRIIIINKGQIVAEDSLEGLARLMQGASRIILKVRAVSDALMTSMKLIPGVIGTNGNSATGIIEIDTDGSADISDRLAAQVAQQGAGLLEIRSESVGLEDIFLKLTSNEEQQGVSI